MTFACRLANTIGPVVRMSYWFPTQNLIKRPCMKSHWIVKASLIFFLLSFHP